MTQLRELSIDYNFLGKLPISFWKLSRLRTLRLEGNEGLLDPPPEVIGGGALRVVEYCRQQYMNDKQARMKHIILTTQSVLRQVNRRHMFDASLFDPEVQLHDGDPDRWFGLQLPYLWDHLLPELRHIWKVEQGMGLHDDDERLPGEADEVTSFDFTQREVMWAFSNYSDAIGPVLRREEANFRRCACIDPVSGERRPCVPPAPGFMCRRECTLLKAGLVRRRDRQDRVWQAYKSSGLEDAMRRAEHEARRYLNSHEGQLWLDEVAYEQAEETLVEAGAVKTVERRHAKAEEMKRTIIARFDAKKRKVAKVRDEKLRKMQTELEKLKLDRSRAREGYVRSAIDQRVQTLTVQLAHIPENSVLDELQQECAAECADVEAGLYESDSQNTSELDSSEYSSEDESPEANRWRRRLLRRDAREMERERQVTASRNNSCEGLEGGRGGGGDAAGGGRADPRGSSAGGPGPGRPRSRGVTAGGARPGTGDSQGSREEGRGGRQKPLEMIQVQMRAAGVLVEDKVYRPLLEPAVYRTGRVYGKARKKLRRGTRHVLEVARLRVRKVALQLNGSFDEVQKELKYEIFRQYVDHHVQLAREKARREFSVIEQGALSAYQYLEYCFIIFLIVGLIFVFL